MVLPRSFMANAMVCQQGADLADQVLQYHSQAQPPKKPRSASRRNSIPSPHQPCLDSPGDQVALALIVFLSCDVEADDLSCHSVAMGDFQ